MVTVTEEQVKISEYYHHAKCDIFYSYVVREIHNISFQQSQALNQLAGQPNNYY